MRAAELPYMHISGYDWTYLWNSMWCVIITMTTVGFGDFVPKTHLGRCIAIMACIWGNFLISLMVVSITESSEFTSPSHKRAFDAIIHDREMKVIQSKAALVIQALFKFKLELEKEEDRMERAEKLSHLNKIRERLKEFQIKRKSLEQKQMEQPLENQI